MVEDRHQNLRRTASVLYRLPACKPIVRRAARLMIQHSPLSLKNRQRLYNFLAKETIPADHIVCDTRLPCGVIKLDLDLNDDLSRMWYYWGYSGYERETVRVFARLVRTKQCVFDVGANIGYYALLAANLV